MHLELVLADLMWLGLVLVELLGNDLDHPLFKLILVLLKLMHHSSFRPLLFH